MNPFKKKTGLAAASKNAAVYASALDRWMAGLSIEEKGRIVAAAKTQGDIEARTRYLRDGSLQFSVWLCVRGSDEALRLVPIPEGAQGGPA